MIFNMKLHDTYFNHVLEGSKDIEIRLLDEKRSKLSIGDTIIFSNNDNYVKVKVVNINIFNSFSELLSQIDHTRLGFQNSSTSAILNELFSIYPESKLHKYKIVSIEFEKII